jgi:hypothetical protein
LFVSDFIHYICFRCNDKGFVSVSVEVIGMEKIEIRGIVLMGVAQDIAAALDPASVERVKADAWKKRIKVLAANSEAKQAIARYRPSAWFKLPIDSCERIAISRELAIMEYDQLIHRIRGISGERTIKLRLTPRGFDAVRPSLDAQVRKLIEPLFTRGN